MARFRAALATPSRLVFGVLLFLFLADQRVLARQASQSGNPSGLSSELFTWLDRNHDGAVESYEGAEAFLFLVESADLDASGSLTTREVALFLAEETAAQDAEARSHFDDADIDKDGRLVPAEFPGHAQVLFDKADADKNGSVSRDEFQALDFEDPSTFLELELERILLELKNQDDELPSRAELRTSLEQELLGARFDVEGPTAIMNGVIGPTTPGRVLELICEHPEVRSIRMEDVPGSLDDESNLRAASWIHRFQFTTLVPNGGEIASGGVDFFLAGTQRLADENAMFGVHSWSTGFGEEGAALPHDDPEHELFLDYYHSIDIPEDFYWFTLDAASSGDIHWMTREELLRYKVLTGPTLPSDPALPSHGPRDAYGLDLMRLRGDEPNAVVPLPEEVYPVLRETFDRYSRLLAPNGKPIHILAQSSWTVDQIRRARNVLKHLLTDVPGSEYGANKAPIANAMATNRATLVLFDNEESMERAMRGELGELQLGMQDLRSNECPVEGTPDYLAHETRDAAFEEILHFIQDWGMRATLPEYDAQIEAANRKAEERGIWKPWPVDDPSSHRNEYFAVLNDNLLDLWAVTPTRYEGQALDPEDIPKGTSHFGRYAANSSSRMKEIDPEGYALVRKFLSPQITYVAELPPSFEGTFHIDFDARLRYTAKSQHLSHVKLRGNNPASLVGNAYENHLTGNAGDNQLEGQGGDDHLDGGPGSDTAIFRGPIVEYSLRCTGVGVTVTDSRSGRDGADLLFNIEHLRFLDRVADTDQIR